MFDFLTLASPTFGKISLLAVWGFGLSWVIAVFSFWIIRWLFESFDIPFITDLLYYVLVLVETLRHLFAVAAVISFIFFLSAVVFNVYSLLVVALNGG